MKQTVGFPISHKENENRRALTLESLEGIKNKSSIYVEMGYGLVMGIDDKEFANAGVHVVSREEVLAKDIICDPKIGDAEYLSQLNGQTLFGWIHAVQNRDITDKIIGGKLTAYAWEDMFEDGRHSFWRNNEIAGEAAILHAYMCHGIFPYDSKVAVIGRGNSARGAIKTLHYMGAEVISYDRRTENLLRKEIGEFDVIVNAILWDTSREDHIIYKEDLARMKKNSMIIDISCDRNGGIETSVPTTIESPTYFVDGIRHYVVDHTPSIFHKTTSKSISQVVASVLDTLIEGNPADILAKAKCIENGKILDERIINFQNREIRFRKN